MTQVGVSVYLRGDVPEIKEAHFFVSKWHLVDFIGVNVGMQV